MKDAETLVTKVLNSTSVVKPNPDADTEPVKGPASVTTPCDGENFDDVADQEPLMDWLANDELTDQPEEEAYEAVVDTNDLLANDAVVVQNDSDAYEDESSQVVSTDELKEYEVVTSKRSIWFPNPSETTWLGYPPKFEDDTTKEAVYVCIGNWFVKTRFGITGIC